jgi:hypothetical protein
MRYHYWEAGHPIKFVIALTAGLQNVGNLAGATFSFSWRNLEPGASCQVDVVEMYELRLMGGVRRALVVVGAVLGVALLSAGVASASDPVQLKSRLGNWCLDGANGNNTATTVNPCDGSKSQLWVFNSAGQIENVAFARDCLTISDAADDAPVTLSPCQTNANNARWNPQTNGQITSALGPCLNVFGGVAQPGTPVIAYHCIPDVADEEWDSVS